MYAGTTFRRDSGRIVGVHQKIDRVSRRQLKKLIGKDTVFPTIGQILHFEGINGPDGIKRKSPSKDEPWHYIDPTNKDDRGLIELINDHMANLTIALKDSNQQRAAFEAAWLAHSIVDGLTPAHHYPLNDKIEELWGKPHTERLTKRDKTIIKGINRRDTLSKNWQYWGIGGVFSAHLAFELGVASTIATQRFSDTCPSPEDVRDLDKIGFEAMFMKSMYKIYDMHMFDEFGDQGWTRRLANLTRKTLVPEIIKVVCLAWYKASDEAKIKTI
ncbi:hypothetical protein EPN95_00505 [Patescibacteria group bacterium]|nr:MAG: hypothetical protein EPN95_00505 [Patescibacteria group bacterium]